MDMDLNGYIRQYEEAKILFERYIAQCRDNKEIDREFYKHFLENMTGNAWALHSKLVNEFE